MEKGSESDQPRPEEVAAYIAGLTAEMVRLARNNKLPVLAYLLDIARMEALERCGRSSDGGTERIA